MSSNYHIKDFKIPKLPFTVDNSPTYQQKKLSPVRSLGKANFFKSINTGEITPQNDLYVNGTKHKKSKTSVVGI